MIRILRARSRIRVGLPFGRTGNSLLEPRGWFLFALKEAKIVGYSWHCNRHTIASRLVMAGVDLLTVSELLGHRTLQMVMRYSHLADEHQAAAVARLADIGNQAGHGKGTQHP